MPVRLIDSEITARLAGLNESAAPPWVLDYDQHLTKTFKFADFAAAFAFMRRVAEEAEKMDHHPDWRNCYNRVEIRLSTYSAGGLTELDFQLARRIEALTND